MTGHEKYGITSEGLMAMNKEAGLKKY